MDEKAVTRYTAQIDLTNVNDPHVLAVGRVPARADVLDLGAADGSVAAVLHRMGCRVWGVEVDSVAAERARGVCEEVVVGDLNRLDLVSTFAERSFGVVLMLDVLEHLIDPAAVLRQVQRLVGDSGWAVISLPNVAHVSVRLALLRGHFDYTDTGLLDKTHLRFFDAKGVSQLLDDAGWVAFDIVHVTRELGTTEVPVELADREAAQKLLANLDSDTDLLTYQFVVTAAPNGSPVLDDPPLLPAAIAQSALLNAQAWTRIPGLWNDLQEIRDASLTRRGHLKHLVSSLRENSDRIAQTLTELG